jgi:hypothetical protein
MYQCPLNLSNYTKYTPLQTNVSCQSATMDDLDTGQPPLAAKKTPKATKQQNQTLTRKHRMKKTRLKVFCSLYHQQKRQQHHQPKHHRPTNQRESNSPTALSSPKPYNMNHPMKNKNQKKKNRLLFYQLSLLSLEGIGRLTVTVLQRSVW